MAGINPCASFDASMKLVRNGIILETEFYYFKKTKQRFYGNNIVKHQKDFHKLYIPAPLDAELNEVLEPTIKEKKEVRNLTVYRDAPSLFKAQYIIPHKVDDVLYFGNGESEADAKIELIIKLLKHGKIKA